MNKCVSYELVYELYRPKIKKTIHKSDWNGYKKTVTQKYYPLNERETCIFNYFNAQLTELISKVNILHEHVDILNREKMMVQFSSKKK
jgi:hypothetical protein